MAVALSLADLRANTPAEVKRAPSLLHTAAEASKIPLAEQAALAANSLNLLSSIDTELPTFIYPLHLNRPTTRQTLDSSAQAALSASAIDLVRRLSPLFPVRHAQRVLEWLINALHAALLAPEAEVDALLVASLPYHSTPQFPTFVAALLFARPLPRWRWLKPVAEQRRPPSNAFLVAHCPSSVHVLAIDWALGLAIRAIPANAASSFLASVTARWIISAAPSDRRIVLLKALVALEDALELPAQHHADLVSAVLSISAAAVVAGVKDDVVPVLGRCLVKAIRKCDGELSASSTVSLSVLVKRYGESAVSSATALRLLRCDVTNLVQEVGRKAQQLFETTLLCAVPEDFPSIDSLRQLNLVMSSHGDCFLTGNIVSSMIVRLLDHICAALCDKCNAASLKDLDEGFERSLAQLLAPLSRGKYTTSVDDGVRIHYEARSKREDMKPVYDVIDNLLLHALQGTTFAASKGQTDKDMSTLCGSALLAALSHPSENMRSNALKQIITKGIPEEVDEQDIAHRLTSMVEVEENAKPLARACQAARQVSACTPLHLLHVYSRSMSKILSSSTLNAEMSHELVEQFVECCSATVKHHREAVLAGIVGFSLGGLLDNKLPTEDMTRIRKLVGKALKEEDALKKELSMFKEGTDLHADIKEVLGLLLRASSICQDVFLDEMKYVNHQWCITVLEHWTASLGQKKASKLPKKTSSTLSHAVELLLPIGPAEEAEPTITKICKILLDDHHDKEELFSQAQLLWVAAVQAENDKVIQHILKQLLLNIGAPRTAAILGRVCTSHKESKVRRTSFQWYFNLAVELPKVLKRDGAVTMVLSLFGPDKEIRVQTQRLLTEHVHRPGDERIPPFNTLHQHVTSPSQPSPEADEGEDGQSAISFGLQKHILQYQQKISNLPASLAFSQASKSDLTNLVEMLFNHYQLNPHLERGIALLRATQGLPLPSVESFQSTLIMIKKCISRLVEARQTSDEDVEEFALHVLSASSSISMFRADEVKELSKGLLRKSIALLHKAEEEIDDHAQNNSLLKVCVVALLSLFLQGGDPTGQQKASDYLLILSSKSSDAASLARRVIDGSLCTSIPLSQLQQALQTINNVSLKENKRKKPRTSSSHAAPPSADDISLGALESILRWVRTTAELKKGQQDVLGDLEQTLWKFVTYTVVKAKIDDYILDEDVEYRLHLVLEALCGLHRLEPDIQTKKNKAINFKALVDATFYPNRDAAVAESAILTGVRRSALVLVETLAPLRANDLRSVAEPLIANLVHAKNSARSFRALRGLVPCLLVSRCPFPNIMTWLCRAGYARSVSPHERDQIRDLMSSSCKSFDNRAEKVHLCLAILHDQYANASAEDLAFHCALLIEEAKVDVAGTFSVVAKAPKMFRSELAVAVLLSDSFKSSLATTLETPPSNSFIDELSSLYSALLTCESTTAKEQAVENTVALLPLSGLRDCTRRCLTLKKDVKIGAVKALSSRIQETESPIRASWSLSGIYGAEKHDVQSEQSSLVGITGQNLCDALILNPHQRGDVEELNRELLTALDCLVTQFGNTNITAVLKYAEFLLDASKKAKSNIESSKKAKAANILRTLLAQYLSCLASFISTLRSKAVSLIPLCVDLALSLMKTTFLGDEKVSTKRAMRLVIRVTEGAVQLCTSVIESAPSLFGQRALKSLASLGTASSSAVVEDLLTMAVQKVPPATGISAMVIAAGDLNTSKAVPAGIQLLLNVVKKAAESFSKAQVKLHVSDMLAIIFNCVMHGREAEELVKVLKEGPTQSEGGKDVEKELDHFENWMRDGKDVDDSAAETVSALVLRLPEVEFKKLFEALDAWSKSEHQIEAEMVLPEKCNDSLRAVPRLLPFYRISLRLFQELQSIFVPYFFQLLDRALASVSYNKKDLGKAKENGEGETKKRKRGRLEEEEESGLLERYSSLCGKTQDVALDCVTQMVRQETCISILSGEVISRIQGAVLAYFDERNGESKKVSRCLSALALRIVEMGNEAETKDESRSLLSGMAREILLHTQDSRESVRKGALTISEGIASAVGEEYLVTLPESMPVLSEVIDDESDAVQKAAKSFAEVMGTIAGEPILDQLK